MVESGGKEIQYLLTAFLRFAEHQPEYFSSAEGSRIPVPVRAQSGENMLGFGVHKKGVRRDEREPVESRGGAEETRAARENSGKGAPMVHMECNMEPEAWKYCGDLS